MTLLRDARDLATQMAWADVAVTAATGLPMLLLTLADNQVPSAAAMAGCGAAVDAGTRWTHDHLAPLLTDVLHDRTRRERLSAAAQRLVDGEGAQRVLDRVLVEG